MLSSDCLDVHTYLSRLAATRAHGKALVVSERMQLGTLTCIAATGEKQGINVIAWVCVVGRGQ